MDRRVFLSALSGTLLAAPLAAEAQQAGKVYRIAILTTASSVSSPSANYEAFVQGLRESGYVEGRYLAIEYRFAEEQLTRLPDLAAELIGLRVGVIIAVGPAVLKAAKSATATVPIVAIDFESDPVAAGFVASIARPGGNVTGTFLDQAELTGKWLELLNETIRKLARVAGLGRLDAHRTS